jgi:hypothetical protein
MIHAEVSVTSSVVSIASAAIARVRRFCGGGGEITTTPHDGESHFEAHHNTERTAGVGVEHGLATPESPREETAGQRGRNAVIDSAISHRCHCAGGFSCAHPNQEEAKKPSEDSYVPRLSAGSLAPQHRVDHRREVLVQLIGFGVRREVRRANHCHTIALPNRSQREQEQLG